MDSTLQKRLLLFLFGCITFRLFFVYLARTLSPINLRYMGYLALIPAIGFLVIYFGGLRKTGPEVFGGKIWWNALRPIHALLYLTFAYMAIHNMNNAYVPLLIDVLIGLGAFLYHYFI